MAEQGLALLLVSCCLALAGLSSSYLHNSGVEADDLNSYLQI